MCALFYCALTSTSIAYPPSRTCIFFFHTFDRHESSSTTSPRVLTRERNRASREQRERHQAQRELRNHRSRARGSASNTNTANGSEPGSDSDADSDAGENEDGRRQEYVAGYDDDQLMEMISMLSELEYQSRAAQEGAVGDNSRVQEVRLLENFWRAMSLRYEYYNEYRIYVKERMLFYLMYSCHEYAAQHHTNNRT